MVRLGLNFLLSLCVIFAVIYASSCADSADCRYIDNREVKVSFGKKSGKVYADSTVSILSVYTYPNGMVLYDSASGNTMSLSLSQNSDTSVFVVKLDTIADTLAFKYTRNLEMTSSECGFNTSFVIDSIFYTKHNIETVQVFDNKIDKDISKNFRIILKLASVQSISKK